MMSHSLSVYPSLDCI